MQGWLKSHQEVMTVSLRSALKPEAQAEPEPHAAEPSLPIARLVAIGLILTIAIDLATNL